MRNQMASQKLKTRLRNMNFQRQGADRVMQYQNEEETKYYEELYLKRTEEFLGKINENIQRTARGGLRSQHI